MLNAGDVVYLAVGGTSLPGTTVPVPVSAVYNPCNPNLTSPPAPLNVVPTTATSNFGTFSSLTYSGPTAADMVLGGCQTLFKGNVWRYTPTISSMPPSPSPVRHSRRTRPAAPPT